MTRAEKARENFLGGDTCSQAVLAAFFDLFADGEKTQALLLALARPFGGGMGRLRLTCGGVSGGVMALGAIFPDLPKAELYALVQEYARRFKAENGSLICGELLAGGGVSSDGSAVPEARTEQYYKKRPCPELVFSAAKILEELLREEGRI